MFGSEMKLVGRSVFSPVYKMQLLYKCMRCKDLYWQTKVDEGYIIEKKTRFHQIDE